MPLPKSRKPKSCCFLSRRGLNATKLIDIEGSSDSHSLRCSFYDPETVLASVLQTL
jgi:hypothetical protein